MNKKEIVEMSINYLNNGATIDEIAEWINEHTDFNSKEIIDEIYKKQMKEVLK
jgi:hypothetical protein